jgi:hypothetical protein
MNAFNANFAAQLVNITGLNLDQIHSIIIHLNYTHIMSDNTILNKLSLFEFDTFGSLCREYAFYLHWVKDGQIDGFEKLNLHVIKEMQMEKCSGRDDRLDRCECHSDSDSDKDTGTIHVPTRVRCCSVGGAIYRRHASCLRSLLLAEHDVSEEILNRAVAKSDVGIVETLHRYGNRKLERKHMYVAGDKGRVETIEYMCRIGIIDRNMFLLAIKYKLQPLVEILCDCLTLNRLDAHVMRTAAESGNPDMIKYLHSRGFIATYSAIREIVESGNLESLDYLSEKGCIEEQEYLTSVFLDIGDDGWLFQRPGK